MWSSDRSLLEGHAWKEARWRPHFELDHLGFAQGGDFSIAEPELAEHGVGVFAALGRRGHQTARCATEPHRLAGEMQDAAGIGRLDVLDHTQVFHLRVGEDLVDAVDWP